MKGHNWCCFFYVLFQKLLSRADADAGQDLDFKEFAEYLQGHEQKLQIVFADLDRNKDGKYSLYSYSVSFPCQP